MTEMPQWQYPDARILVFARAPRAGDVKTRLAERIGAEEAARVYSDWVQTTVWGLHRASIAPLELWVTPDGGHPLFERLTALTGAPVHPQPGGDLGERMHRVLADALERHHSAVLVGTDCPVMQPDYVGRALAVLQAGVDTVLGPVEDGGYVLIGLRKPAPELFAGIPWSGAGVLDATRRRLRGAPHRNWAELETLWDIDDADDYERWRALQGAAPPDARLEAAGEVQL